MMRLKRDLTRGVLKPLINCGSFWGPAGMLLPNIPPKVPFMGGENIKKKKQLLTISFFV